MTEKKPSMLEVHSQALEAVDEAYHNFLLIYRKDDPCVYGFVEGKDDPIFYRNLIERKLPQEWSIKFVTTGSKQKVLCSFRSINWSNFCRERICFFIDRDLQDFLDYPPPEETNIYITDGYSIENYILQTRLQSLLQGVLADVYQITLLKPEEEELINRIFEKNLDTFVESMMPLMGQILRWRKLGSKANLSNLMLDNIFKFVEANIVPVQRNELLKLAAKQMGCELCQQKDIITAEMEIRRHQNSYMIVRGKYVFWFFIKQCEALWNTIPNLLPRFTEKPSRKIEFGIKNAMVIIGSRTYLPASLEEFINLNYLSFIRNVSKS